MIRRDTTIDDATVWVIIPQVVHARLSGRLAEAFDAERLPLLGERRLRGVLLDAIYRHDNGWARWDPFLELDAASGAPRQFTEMLPDESWAIWLHSIRGVGAANPLGGHLVARHFAVLLARHLVELPADDPLHGRGEQFDARLDRIAADYLARWRAEVPESDETADWPERGLALLQAFDYLSLWLCCRERPEPLELDVDGRPLRFTAAGEGCVTVSPWPFSEPELTVRARGQAIRAGTYCSNAELAATERRGCELVWRLRPADEGTRKPGD